MKKYTPFYVPYAGEFVKDEIEYRGISQRTLAGQMGLSPTVVNEVLNGKRPMSAEFAMIIEAVLDIDADMLNKIQAQYNMSIARKDTKIIARLAKIRQSMVAAVL